MDKLSRINECVIIGRCKIGRLLYADDLALLAYSESSCQHALKGFALACDCHNNKFAIEFCIDNANCFIANS